jgi:glucosamine-6-phosphate deaminase
MPIRVIVTNDFDHMSAVAADHAMAILARVHRARREAVLGLATGRTPTGLYRLLAKAANAGAFDASRIRTFNLDEYIGLPGDNAEQRVRHPESYASFMIREFFSLLERTFAETTVPWGALVEPQRFASELGRHPGDWTAEGEATGKSIVISATASSEYLAWIRRDIQQGYERKISSCGGIDLQVIGVGGNGHVGFHEAGIPFEASRVLLVRLDDETVRNAVADGHFATERDCPRYAVSMGAELVFEARSVLLLASGERKRVPLARSLLEGVSTGVPVSYGQRYAANGGNLVCVVDAVAGADLAASRSRLAAKGIELEDLRS